jgi:hypothetical protein
MPGSTSTSEELSPRTRFVILCLGRTGSTHLWSLLDSHPEVRCFGEVLNDEARDPDSFVLSGRPAVVPFLRDLLDSPAERVSGLKLPMNSLRAHPEARALLDQETDIRVVRLSRVNRLEQIISRRLMAQTGVAHSIHGEYGGTRIRVDPANCLRAIETIEAEEAELDGIALGHPTFQIAYEEIDSAQRLLALQHFLGVAPARMSSWFTRLQRRPLPEVVENWGELEAALRAAGYGSFVSA